MRRRQNIGLGCRAPFGQHAVQRAGDERLAAGRALDLAAARLGQAAAANQDQVVQRGDVAADLGRELRERIKARFDAEGIEIPFPQRVVWHRDGSAAQDGADASQAGRDPSNIRVAREGEVSAPGDQGDGSD